MPSIRPGWLNLALLCVISSSEKTVVSPFAAETLRNDWQIGNPENTTQKTRPRRIQELPARHLLPVRLIQNVVWFVFRCYTSGKVRVHQVGALGDVDLK